ncbi:sensor histidine kinase [uncultured Polaribacter sp.]|uniref:sensor histidine kinase n=1 Tax=uncultured Polaribacter sp. TaxID=174711 RepID=UPI00263511ED|nr:sensor histidine kinase [uncultured Polaribacter sp.]
MFSQQNSLQLYKIENGLPSNQIIDITQDQIGYLWVTTDKGVVKFDGNDFVLINKQKATSVLSKNNTIFLGTNNGLIIKKTDNEQFLETKKVNKIYTYKNNIYVATVQGIYKNNKDYLKPLRLNTQIDFSIVTDIIFLNDSFYVATNKGLWILNDLDNPIKVKKIINDNIVCLTKFQKKIIVATKNNGLQIVDNNIVKKQISTLKNISSIEKIKNDIWIASYDNGIEVLSLPSFTFKHKINKYNAIATNKIIKVYNDIENTVWLATNKGLYSLKNTQKQKNNNSKIFFENLVVNHQNVDSLLYSKKKVKFTPSENNILFKFKSINLIYPKNILYRYKINDNFSSWSTKNEVQFANLKAGKYNFKIQSSVNGKKSDIKSFSFIIDQVFYKKIEFILALIGLFFVIGYFILDSYIKSIHQKNKAKVEKLQSENHLLSLEQKALQLQMNPHFIFNVLNSIKALGNSGKTEELNSTISSFSKLLRNILNNSRLEEISLHSEINSLKNYIELEQKMSSKIFNYDITTSLNSIDPEEILIPSMLIQPFIENSIKHGFKALKKGKITVSFEVKNKFLECTVIDDGIGINQSKKQKENTAHQSVALKIAKERIENISSLNSFKINEILENKIVKGTKIWFKIPLKTDY